MVVKLIFHGREENMEKISTLKVFFYRYWVTLYRLGKLVVLYTARSHERITF